MQPYLSLLTFYSLPIVLMQLAPLQVWLETTEIGNFASIAYHVAIELDPAYCCWASRGRFGQGEYDVDALESDCGKVGKGQV